MKYMKGVVISGKGKMEISEKCPLPDQICDTGALIRPLIWSPCTSDAHLCETGCASLPYLLGKAVGHEMCGEIVEVGSAVKDFKVGDQVIVCAVLPIWRSLEAQDHHAKNHQDHGMKQIPEAMNLFLNHDRSLIKPVIYNDKEQK